MTTVVKPAALLAHLGIKKWGVTKKDREISREVAQNKGATEDAGKYVVILSDAQVLADIKSAESTARRKHAVLTLPWGDRGLRILPGPLYFEYVKVMNVCKGEFMNHAARLFQEWPAIMAAERASARLGQGQIFRPENYPTLEVLKTKYDFTVDILPFPESSHFAVELGEEAEQQLRDQLTESVKESMAAANRDAFERLYRAVHHMSDAVARFGGPRSRLYESVVSNLADLVAILPGLNITRDPALDSLATEAMEKLCKYKVEELKDSESLRSDAVSAATAILNKMKDYV